MSIELNVQLNGNLRSFPDLSTPTDLASIITHLELKSDRIAVELNGDIAPRTQWSNLPVSSGDKIEIVHFVGGGI
jgi:sulfur carrier protein